MVKILVAEEALASTIQSWSDKKETTIGLLIGKTTSTKDYVIKFVKSSQTLETDKDVSQVAGHAVEVSHVLPGGITVIGIFAVAESDTAKSLHKSLRQALYSTYKFLMQSCPYQFPSNEDPVLWTAIHFDITTGRTIFSKQFNVLEPVATAKPVDLKYQQPCTRWSFLYSNVDINVSILKNHLSGSTKQQLQEFVKPFSDQVMNGIVTFGDVVLKPSEVLDPETVTKGGKGTRQKHKQTVHPKFGKTFHCKLYLQNGHDDINIPEMNVDEGSSKLNLSGCLYTCAYVPLKATVADAVEVLKHDLIKSVYHRCSLLSDDLKDLNQSITSQQYTMFPKRVCFPKSNSDDFKFYEYVFSGEPLEDCVSRIQTIFDPTTTAEDIDASLEMFRDIECQSDNMENNEIDKPLKSEIAEDIEVQPDNQGSFPLSAILAAGAAFLAAALSYFSFSD